MGLLQGTEFFISKRVGRAMTDYSMLSEGDRIVVAVSGGKDSLSLLKVLKDRQRFVPVRYSLIAVHIDSGYPRSCASALGAYFRKIKVDYKIVKTDAIRKSTPEQINCFWCSWNRRKELFLTADRLKANKIALGHHKDDIAETILMNIFFHGETSSMKPKQELFEGKIVIIRPFAYVEEQLICKFVKEEKMKLFDCQCPHSVTSNRERMTKIIRSLEKICPEVRTNICKSATRIKHEYLA